MIVGNTSSMSQSLKKTSTSKPVTEIKKRHPKKVISGEGGTSSIKYVNNNDVVTQLGNALVREYLSRHGCKKSLTALMEQDEKVILVIFLSIYKRKKLFIMIYIFKKKMKQIY